MVSFKQLLPESYSTSLFALAGEAKLSPSSLLFWGALSWNKLPSNADSKAIRPNGFRPNFEKWSSDYNCLTSSNNSLYQKGNNTRSKLSSLNTGSPLQTQKQCHLRHAQLRFDPRTQDEALKLLKITFQPSIQFSSHLSWFLHPPTFAACAKVTRVWSTMALQFVLLKQLRHPFTKQGEWSY